MIAYLDTNVVLWLAESNLERITEPAKETIRRADLLLSPLVLLELQYLHEVGKTALVAQDVVRKLEQQIGLRRCDLSFEQVIVASLSETWTREPFDRLITAHAKANGYATLITADKKIRQNYPGALW